MTNTSYRCSCGYDLTVAPCPYHGTDQVSDRPLPRITYAEGYRHGQDALRAGLDSKPVGVVQSQHYAAGFFDGYRDLAAEDAS